MQHSGSQSRHDHRDVIAACSMFTPAITAVCPHSVLRSARPPSPPYITCGDSVFTFRSQGRPEARQIVASCQSEAVQFGPRESNEGGGLRPHHCCRPLAMAVWDLLLCWVFGFLLFNLFWVDQRQQRQQRRGFWAPFVPNTSSLPRLNWPALHEMLYLCSQPCSAIVASTTHSAPRSELSAMCRQP